MIKGLPRYFSKKIREAGIKVRVRVKHDTSLYTLYEARVERDGRIGRGHGFSRQHAVLAGISGLGYSISGIFR